MPIQADFLLRRLGEQAAADPSLADRQPWKAVAEQDHAWLGACDHQALRGRRHRPERHGRRPARRVRGDDDRGLRDDRRRVPARRRGTRRWAGRTCGPRSSRWSSCCATWRRTGSPATSPPAAAATSSAPSAQEVYGIPPERVIGSTVTLEYRDGRIVHTAKLDVFDDGPAKPVRIWSRIGRRPLLAGGNANGDVPMLSLPRPQPPGLRPAGPARRRRARVRLHRRRGRRARAGGRSAAGRSSASGTTGRRSSPTSASDPVGCEYERVARLGMSTAPGTSRRQGSATGRAQQCRVSFRRLDWRPGTVSPTHDPAAAAGRRPQTGLGTAAADLSVPAEPI